MYESATYDAMADLVSTSGHDLYVFDMPPFGHGVRMIAMAGILSQWVGKITEAREKAQEYEAVAATLKGGKVSEDGSCGSCKRSRRRSLGSRISWSTSAGHRFSWS